MKNKVGLWLLACSALVWVILVSGGVTRLTHSGLSIVEWKPIVGALPPLNRGAWEREFELYRRTPEYQKINAGMSLDDFRSIYWMEYFHRLLGRLAGLAFVAPFLFLVLGRRVNGSLAGKLAAIALLWAFQGALGWYMVASGLVEEPHVSHYRLTAHLTAGCLLFAAMFSTALGLLRPAGPAGPAPGAKWLRASSALLVAGIFVTIVSGGLVAGLRAGLVCGTFPRMFGRWVPPLLESGKSPLRSLLDDAVAVQFDHRLLAALLGLGVLACWLGALRAGLSSRARISLHILAGVMALQAVLGIATLVYGVPVLIATAHQGMALILLGAALFVWHESAARADESA